MIERSVASEDGKTRCTNYLCEACCKRVLKVTANPVIPVEVKARPVAVGNPHNRRRSVPVVSTAGIPVTQDESDQKV
jgi:hypothetical protein